MFSLWHEELVRVKVGEGKYLKLPIDKIADFDLEENEWRVISSSVDPINIEIVGK